MNLETYCKDLVKNGYYPAFNLLNSVNWRCTLQTTNDWRNPEGTGPTMQSALDAALKDRDFIKQQKKR